MPDDDPEPQKYLARTRMPRSEATAKVKAWRGQMLAKHKVDAELTRRSRALFVIQIALAVNDLDQLLDEFKHEDRRKDRRQLLERSLALSIRALDLLQREPLVVGDKDYITLMHKRLEAKEWSAREELRQDETTLRLFLGAECRLLADLGVSDAAVSRIRDSLEAVLRQTEEAVQQAAAEYGRHAETEEQFRARLQEQMQDVVGQLTAELSRLSDDARHQKLIGRLAGVFAVLGGVLVIAANASVALPAAPVSGGLSSIGAALSIAAGGEVISRGVDLAKGED